MTNLNEVMSELPEINIDDLQKFVQETYGRTEQLNKDVQTLMRCLRKIGYMVDRLQESEGLDEGDMDSRRTEALAVALSYGCIPGGHHKDWVIDQMCRALLGDEYDEFVANARDGEDGPNTYDWDVGIAP